MGRVRRRGRGRVHGCGSAGGPGGGFGPGGGPRGKSIAAPLAAESTNPDEQSPPRTPYCRAGAPCIAARARCYFAARARFLLPCGRAPCTARFAGQKISPSSPTRGCPAHPKNRTGAPPAARGNCLIAYHRRVGGARSSIYSASIDENVIICRTLYSSIIGEFRGDRTEVGWRQGTPWSPPQPAIKQCWLSTAIACKRCQTAVANACGTGRWRSVLQSPAPTPPTERGASGFPLGRPAPLG